MTDLVPPPFKSKLHGKVAIVTGGASGIGEATARHFINHGARAVVIADVLDEKGRNVAVSICSDRCAYIHCDVSDEDQVKSLVELTVSKYGRLDIMFSNAGIPSSDGQTVLDMDMSKLDKVYAINARGMAACVKHAARAMKEGGVRGRIICTASVLATRGFWASTDYVMAKHAVVGLVRSASLQLAGDGIRVNSVSPGMVGTPLTMMRWGLKDEEEMEKMVEKFSMLKGMLREKHVADAVTFLASDESEFVTGLDLAVDGGFIARQP
ncbi:(+)-cis,trans-nepetalactol synthase NEPS2-like [Ziziphus jujuba]|uniref:(+)-cis,trans-nepetalactol synthase NEPS2-like n=1 Tax=Ziziphus jujuba TaxID=326968 RepID=A0ABM3IK29_ZIZJJ|nr:(+)-cis,trans-nepetalactol synthase NEPS2-like [Ziziphus jujuba]